MLPPLLNCFETNCEPQELECGCAKHPGSLYLYLPIHGSMPRHAEASVVPATDFARYINEDAEDFAQKKKVMEVSGATAPKLSDAEKKRLPLWCSAGRTGAQISLAQWYFFFTAAPSSAMTARCASPRTGTYAGAHSA